MDSEHSTDLFPSSQELIESFRSIVQQCGGDLDTLNQMEKILSDEKEKASPASVASGSGSINFGGSIHSEIIEPDLQSTISPQVDNLTTSATEYKDLVTFHPEYFSVDKLVGLQEEVAKLFELNNTKYIWLSKQECTYKFGGRSLKSLQICHSELLTRIMKNINDDLGFEMDSCLITRYQKGTDGLSRHQDNEEVINQQHPICNLSIGSSREVQFWTTSKEGTGLLAHDIFMQEGALAIMQPGCQQKLWHKVLPGEADTRYCLSFRKCIVSDIVQTPQRSTQNFGKALSSSTPLVLKSENEDNVIPNLITESCNPRSDTLNIPLPEVQHHRNGFPVKPGQNSLTITSSPLRSFI